MEHVIRTGQLVVGDTLKWIGFDLDDTLHFYRRASGQACEAVFQYLYEEFGAPPATLRAKYGGILKTAQSGSFAEGKTSRDYRAERFGKLLAAFSIIPYRHLEAVLDLFDKTLSRSLKLKDGAKETLLAARDNGLQIMVVSEGPHDAQEAALERLGIAPLVDLLITSGAEKTSKAGRTAKNYRRQGAMLTA
jgi:putative hydrolase of the HAD superfamily